MIGYGWTVTIHFNFSMFQFSFFREEETIIYLYYRIVGRIKRDSYKVLVWISGKYRAQQIWTLASIWLFLAVMLMFFIIQLRSILSPEGWLSATASSELPSSELAFQWVQLVGDSSRSRDHGRTEEGGFPPSLSAFILSSWPWLGSSFIALLIAPPPCLQPSLALLILLPLPVASDWVIKPLIGPLNPVYTSESSHCNSSLPLNHQSGILFPAVDLDWHLSHSSFQPKLVSLNLGKIWDLWSRIYINSANICYCLGHRDIK